MDQRSDFSEFADELRVKRWRSHVGPEPGVSTLMDEALGHAVGLREAIYGQTEDHVTVSRRALELVDVLSSLRDLVDPES